MFCLSKPVDTNHVPAGLEYPRGGQLEINHDLEGQSRGYIMTSFQTVPCHIASMGDCLAGRENCFQQFNRFNGRT